MLASYYNDWGPDCVEYEAEVEVFQGVNYVTVFDGEDGVADDADDGKRNVTGKNPVDGVVVELVVEALHCNETTGSKQQIYCFHYAFQNRLRFDLRMV